MGEVLRVIKGTEVGNEVTLTIFRSGETFVVPVKLGKKPMAQDDPEECNVEDLEAALEQFPKSCFLSVLLWIHHYSNIPSLGLIIHLQKLLVLVKPD